MLNTTIMMLVLGLSENCFITLYAHIFDALICRVRLMIYPFEILLTSTLSAR